MKLSMWVLYDWLKPLGATEDICDGAQVLRGARMLTEECGLEKQTVYIETTADGSTVCAHGHDIIHVPASSADVVLNEVLRAFDYYNVWIDGLRDRVREGCTLRDLLIDSEPVIDDPLSVLDAGYVAIALSSHFETRREYDLPWMNLMEHGRMSFEFIQGVRDLVLTHLDDEQPYLLALDPVPCLCRNLFVRRLLAGWVCTLPERHPYTPGRAVLLGALGAVVEEWLRFHEDDRQMLDASAFLSGLLSGVPAPQGETEHRFRVMGWNMDDPKIIVRIAATADMQKPLCATLTAAMSNGVAFPYEDGVVLLVDLAGKDLPGFYREAEALLNRTRCRGGCSNVFTDVAQLRRQYNVAVAALGYGSNVLCQSCEPAAAYITDVLRNSLLPEMCHPDIVMLLEYDRRHGTAFCETLRQYLLCERSLTAVCSATGLHRNTLYYRLNRLKEMLSADLDDPDVRLHLMLSFRVMPEFPQNRGF